MRKRMGMGNGELECPSRRGREDKDVLDAHPGGLDGELYAGGLQHSVLSLNVLAAFDGLVDCFFKRKYLLFHARPSWRASALHT